MKVKQLQINLLAKKASERTVESLRTKYINPYRQPVLNKAVDVQLSELAGDVEFGKGLYHNQAFEETSKQLLNIRKRLQEPSLKYSDRLTAYKQHIEAWRAYIQHRYTELPEELAFTQRMRDNVLQAYQMQKDRKEGLLTGDRATEMHFELASLFKFSPVIDIQFIEQMVHPARGYLSHVPHGLTYEQIIELYEVLIVATFEKLLGQNLLAHNLSSFGFWTLIDKQKAGYLSFPEFLQLLRMVRFQNIINPDDFKKEFPTVIQTHPYLLQDKNSDAVPLSAFSHLFLERNL